MSTQHTPGPWQILPDAEQRANAMLIAAAPELLEALKMALRQNAHDMIMTGEECRQCHAAIAKATGVKAA